MRKEKKNITISIILVLLLIVILQVITVYVITNIKDNNQDMIPNVLKMTYIENTGGAFGIGQNSTVGFVIVSLIVIAIILRFLISKRESMNTPTCVALSFILAGGISNLIDRIVRGFVVDYIDISGIFKFPVFNLADMFICIGWIAIVIFTIIYWKKELK